jgi:hypothetical protein
VTSTGAAVAADVGGQKPPGGGEGKPAAPNGGMAPAAPKGEALHNMQENRNLNMLSFLFCFCRMTTRSTVEGKLLPFRSIRIILF